MSVSYHVRNRIIDLAECFPHVIAPAGVDLSRLTAVLSPSHYYNQEVTLSDIGLQL